MKRILTGLLLAPLIVYVVLWGPYAAFLAVLAAVAVFCFYEYSGIVAAYGIERPGPVGYCAGLVLLVLPGDGSLLLVLFALLMLAAAIGSRDLKDGLPRAAAAALGVLYIFGVWRFAALLRLGNPHWLMFALAVSWAADTAAYYTGRAFGRHKMAPRVSPGKSWEGAVGSLAGAVVFGILYLPRAVDLSLPLAAGIAAAANVAGQAGDLAESALKRGAGVKDSGTMLPGHGGWLDRVDSSLFTVPLVYFLVELLKSTAP